MEQQNRDLNDMAIFAEIVSTGGISAAASKIGLPKSNVSRRLARLEQRLGVQLIERSTRSSRLTSVGQCYADFCSSMLEEADAADNVIAKSFDGPAGEVKVSVSVLVGQQIIAPALAKYLAKYPDVLPSLVLTNQIVNLIDDGFDLVFRIGSNKDSNLISQTVGKFPQRLYASPGYLEKKGTPITPDDLSAHQCLMMGEVHAIHQWQLSNAGNQATLDIAPGGFVNDFISLKTTAVHGAGIVLLPEYAAYEELRTGRLVLVLEDWLGPVSELNAIYASRRGATPKVRLLIDEVKQYVTKLTNR
jgi:DNA-binding transcriptional LysR family regulator